MSPRPLYLLVNDDGVHAAGIHALAEVAAEFGDVVIVAPHVERSAQSHAITIAMPLRMEKIADNIYGVEGTPADCVLMATRKILRRKPSWVLAGINHGANVSIDTLYSGTIGGAMEGCLCGYPAMAAALVANEKYDFAPSQEIVRILLNNEMLLGAARGGVLNINIPNAPLQDIKGFAVSSLGKKTYDEVIVKGVDPRGKPYYWLGGGGEMFHDVPQSDCVVVDQGYVSLSVLKPSLFDQDSTGQLKTQLGSSLDDCLQAISS